MGHPLTPSRFQGSLTGQVLIILLLAALAVSVILTAFQVHFQYRSGIAAMNHNIDELDRTLVAPLTEALWTSNYELVQQQLTGIAQVRDIAHVRLEENGIPVAEAGTPMPEPVIHRTFPLVREFNGENRLIGILTVVADTEALKERLNRHAISTLAVQSINNMIVIITLFLLFHYLVTRHLVNAARLVKEVDLNHPAPAAPPNLSWINQRNEVGLLYGSVSELSRRLAEELDRRRQAEENLRESHAMLERKVDERTRELAELNERLNERVEAEVGSRRMKEQLLVQQSKMAAMGEMIGVIGHQWKQPLNAISLVAGIIEGHADELSPEERSRHARTISNQVSFLSSTLDHFRNFLKPSDSVQEFGLREAVNDVISLISPVLDRQEISVEIVQADGSEWVLDGYPNELKQVILNVLNNAMDAIRTGKNPADNGVITVQLSESGDEVVIEISDNGGGIPEHALYNMFEPYFTTKGTAGTGIGLYMAKVIVEQKMHGRITASNRGGGAVICISLPNKRRIMQAPPAK